ncbi:hypothetical protein C6P99_16015 [Burkholderia multivorans]|uniref:Uncharacterized protein n=1 Tax=Burkholderia multivorans TaxID=87883 RepID=A0AB37AWE6_9BURK|nr:hypothetical protein C6P99_16015 [Burkholderia multivorans]
MFAVERTEDYRYKLVLEGESLGVYEEAQHAVDALCDGDVFQPTWRAIDFETLDVPRNLYDWRYEAD